MTSVSQFSILYVTVKKELQPLDLAYKPLDTRKVPKLEASVQPLYEDITDTEDDEKTNAPPLLQGMTEHKKTEKIDDGRIHMCDFLAGNIWFLKDRKIEDQIKILKVIYKYPVFYQRFRALESIEQQRWLNTLLSKEPVIKLLHFHNESSSSTSKQLSVPEQEILKRKKTCPPKERKPRKKLKMVTTSAASIDQPPPATGPAPDSKTLLIGQSCGPPGRPHLDKLGMVDEEGRLLPTGIECAQDIVRLHISKKGAGSHTNY